MDDNSHLPVIRGIISLGLSSFLGLFFGFLTVTVAARILPPEEFGVYSLIVVIASLLDVFAGFGIQLSAAKFIASTSSQSEQQFIVNNLLTFRIITLITVSLVSILAKPLFLKFFPSQLLAQLFILVPILFSVQGFENTLAYMMQGFKQFRLMAIVQLLSNIFTTGLVLLFLLVFHSGVAGFLWGTIISLILSAYIRFRMIPVPKALTFDPKLMKKILYFGIPLQGNDLLSFAFQKLDVLILGALIGPSSIAYLNVASKLPDYLNRLYQAIQSVYFPHMAGLFANKQDDQAANVLNNFLRLTSVLTMFGALVFILFQHQLITLVFSEKYLPSAAAAGVLMVASGFGTISRFMDTSLISNGKPSYILVINVVTALVSVVSNLTLIPLLGFIGAAFAELLANAISLPVSGVCLWREKIRFSVREPLLPMVLLFTCLGIYFGFHNDNLIVKVLLILLFCLASFGLSLFSKLDVINLWDALSVWRQRLASGKGQ